MVQRVARIRAKPDCDADYIYHIVGSYLFSQYLLSELTGTSVPHISAKQINGYTFRLPPLPEQRAIADILSTWDEAIALTEQLIVAVGHLKKGLMQQLLTGQTRFPEFDREPIEFDRLEDHIDLLAGFAFESSQFLDEAGIRLLRGTNITSGSTRWDEGRTQYWPKVSEDFSKYLLELHDVVIGMDGSLVGRNFAMIRESDLPVLLVQRVARLRSKNGLSQLYLFQNIGNSFFTRYVDSRKTVTAIPHISANDIKNFEIFLPSLVEQERIANLLASCDEVVQILTCKHDALREQKKGLMQQLLTGQIRVGV